MWKKKTWFNKSRFNPASFSTSRADCSIAASFTQTKTFSDAARARMISAYTRGMGEKFPGQCSLLCGHASQVPSCGSHSAGIRYELFFVILDLPRIHKWPVFFLLIDHVEITLR